MPRIDRSSSRRARNEFVAFQVMLRGDVPAGAIKADLAFDGPTGKTIQVAVGRYHPVPARAGPMPDPIVPLGFAAENTPRTKYQSLHVEVYIPHAPPPASIPASSS